MIPRGIWHQFGDKSQRQAITHLTNHIGVGAIISPRDLSLTNAEKYCNEYSSLGACLLFDPQFHVPSYSNDKQATYPLDGIKAVVEALDGPSLTALAYGLESINRSLKTCAVIAPAIIYAAGKPRIHEINEQLFNVAKAVGDSLGLPTIATVFIGNSAIASSSEISKILSHATALKAAGWYYAFEFSPGRIPSSVSEVVACGDACLTLAATGKPVIHGFAGPMSLLSFGFGASAAAIGHSQNLWQFHRERFAPTKSGGNGGAPPRYFSRGLWGTIISPDELVRLNASLRGRVLVSTPFSDKFSATTIPSDWSRLDAGQHLVHVIANTVTPISCKSTARLCAAEAIKVLDVAIKLHSDIVVSGALLKEESQNTYQANWRTAVTQFLSKNTDNLDFLEML